MVSEDASHPERVTGMDELGASIETFRAAMAKVLQRIETSAADYERIAAQTQELAKQVSEAHERPTPERLRLMTSALRSLEAGLIRLEMKFHEGQLIMVQALREVERLRSTSNPETSKAATELEQMVKKAQTGLDQYVNISAKFSGIMRTLGESVSLAYLQVQDERQRIFENRMQVIGIAIAVVVGILTVVSTAKALGWI